MMTELITIENIVKKIVGGDCKFKLDIVRKTFMVETEKPIPEDQVEQICRDVYAFVSLRNFKGNVIFFVY